MAEFTVQETEGVRNIKLDIRDETVRAARGALSHMHGAIQFTPRLPNAADLLRTVMTEEVCIRPYFTGSGTIYLQSSLKGYHVLDVAQGDLWVLEPGVYWASEGSVDLGIFREPFWDALWAGDGFFAWKTTAWSPLTWESPSSIPPHCLFWRPMTAFCSAFAWAMKTSGSRPSVSAIHTRCSWSPMSTVLPSHGRGR